MYCRERDPAPLINAALNPVRRVTFRGCGSRYRVDGRRVWTGGNGSDCPDTSKYVLRHRGPECPAIRLAQALPFRLKGKGMTIENTDLERRVLAHERILQALIAHMAEGEPQFLERLQARFNKNHDLGDGGHDYVDTEQHARYFIDRVIEIGAIPK